VAFLRGKGIDALGIDAAPSMVEAARAQHPESAPHFHVGVLPKLDVPSGPFDLVLATAVLMHVPSHAIFDAALRLREQVRPGGQLLVSIPLGRRGDPVEHRDVDGRLFHPYSATEIQVLFERLGFVLRQKTEDVDGLGRGLAWCTLLFAREAGDRAVREIEALIWRDLKVATYKFALLRALCEIAQTQPKAASWRADGDVGVPLGRVVTLWMHYYWAFVESTSFVPQSTGELSGKPLKFRKSLAALAVACRPLGGLTGFHLMIRGAGLPSELSRLAWSAARDVAEAVVKGPVAHARQGDLFRYEGSGRRGPTFSEAALEGAWGAIVVPGAIWRELTLLGHWIGESLLLRWAEKTRELSGRGMSVGAALELLLKGPDPKRETADAKVLFLELDDLRCIWTGRSLDAESLEVDHVIPWSIWHNNDLWNLMPSHETVNRRKGDGLVTLDLLRARQAPILETWELLQGRHPARFAQEARQSLHPTAVPSLDFAWSGLLEAVETTAIQRGIQRWAP